MGRSRPKFDKWSDDYDEERHSHREKVHRERREIKRIKYRDIDQLNDDE